MDQYVIFGRRLVTVDLLPRRPTVKDNTCSLKSVSNPHLPFVLIHITVVQRMKEEKRSKYKRVVY